MFRLIFILATVAVLCQVEVAFSVESTVAEKYNQQQEDSSNDQLRLFSPIDVNPDEFENRGKLYKPICPTLDPLATAVDYFTAFRSCMKDDLQLAWDASPEDSKKLRRIVKSMGDGQQVWFGGTDLGKSGSWIWLPILRPVGEINDHQNWKDGEPGTAGHCMAAEIIPTGEMKWSAVDCETALCYICEKNLT